MTKENKALENATYYLVNGYQTKISDFYLRQSDQKPGPVCEVSKLNFKCFNKEELSVSLAFYTLIEKPTKIPWIKQLGDSLTLGETNFDEWLATCTNEIIQCPDIPDLGLCIPKNHRKNSRVDDQTKSRDRGYDIIRAICASVYFAKNRNTPAKMTDATGEEKAEVLALRRPVLFYFSSLNIHLLYLGYYALFSSFVGKTNRKRFKNKYDMVNTFNALFKNKDWQQLINEMEVLKQYWYKKVAWKEARQWRESTNNAFHFLDKHFNLCIKPEDHRNETSYFMEDLMGMCNFIDTQNKRVKQEQIKNDGCVKTHKEVCLERIVEPMIQFEHFFDDLQKNAPNQTAIAKGIAGFLTKIKGLLETEFNL